MGDGAFRSWADVVDRRPHPAFEKIRAQGYEVWYGFEDGEGPGGPTVLVQVRLGGAVVGEADFSADDEWSAHCQNVRVDEGHRRRGLGNALYVFAEAVLGRRLFDFWAGIPF